MPAIASVTDTFQLTNNALDKPPKRAEQGKLAPLVDSLIHQFTTEVGPEDKYTPAQYIEALRSCPAIKAAHATRVLMGLQCLGDYIHPDEKIQEFVRENLTQMQGSYKLSVAQLFSAWPIGYAASERAVQKVGNEWRLESLAVLRPDRWNFEGSRGQIEDVLYRSTIGDIRIPYGNIVHVINHQDFTFNEPYGVSDLRSAMAPFEAWKLIVSALVVAAKRKATGLLKGEYEPMSGVVPVFNKDNTPKLDSQGNQITRDPRPRLGGSFS